MADLEEETGVLKEGLGIKYLHYLESRNGLISEGKIFDIGNGKKIFAKVNKNAEAHRMFEGEVASLEALSQTNKVRVPEPIKILDIPSGGSILTMEFLDITEIYSQHAQLGEQLASLHLHNEELRKKMIRSESIIGEYERCVPFTDKFGFSVTTCVGSVPQIVNWEEDWVKYFSNLMEYRVRLIENETPLTSYAREVRDLWTRILRQVPHYFKGIDIRPSLLHGDLHRYNAGELLDEGPVVFDPACFYGHSECDLAVGLEFPGFDGSFYKSYFQIIPKAKGFDNRLDLYILNQLFNYCRFTIQPLLLENEGGWINEAPLYAYSNEERQKHVHRLTY